MGFITDDLSKRWPGSHIPYRIGRGQTNANSIANAINTLESITTFQFSVRSRQRNYIEFWELNEIDPLPGPAVGTGRWSSIRIGHELLNLGGNRILDWEAGNGHYRIWNYNPNVAGKNIDPFPGPAVVEGTWRTIRSGHWLINLGGNRILDWEPRNGHYRIWNYDPNITGNHDPFPGPAVVEGTWQTIRTGHWLVNLGGNRILDWEPRNGHYRIWNYDQSITGNHDPFPGPAVVEGEWSTIRTGHWLINLDGNRILDWEPENGHYRIWNYDPSITGSNDPFPGRPVIEGSWKSIRSGHYLFSLSPNFVLDWVPLNGSFRIWQYDPNAMNNSSNSLIGMNGGKQRIELSPNTPSYVVIHEILHSMGLLHEHQRPDRDGSVAVHPENVASINRHNFTQRSGTTIGAYDYDSIMHYARFTFSNNGRPSVEAPQPNTTTIGTATTLSNTDIDTVKYIADPFPGPAVVEGAWRTIRSGHQLINLGGNRILDWVPATGQYRIWRYNPNITGSNDPFPGSAVVEGAWRTIRSGHQLINLGGNRILDWVPVTGQYRIWRYDPNITGNNDPFPGPAVVEGAWRTIRSGHQLINLGEDRILDWVPATGQYRIWRYDSSIRGNNDPFPGQEIANGSWRTIRSSKKLIYLNSDRILDWRSRDGYYRIWNYAR